MALRFNTESEYQTFLNARQSRDKSRLPLPASIRNGNYAPLKEDKAVVLLRSIIEAKLCGVWYREFTFHESRGWRIDVANPFLKVGVEVDGGIHRVKDKFARDMEKSNALILAGWRVLRCTPAQVDSGYALSLLKALLAMLLPTHRHSP